MSTPAIVKYPYDPTGVAETNLVVGELHSVPIIRNRAFALNAGPFFANSLKVRTLPNNTLLTRGVDYEVLYLYQEATRKVGAEITAVVFITNASISGNLSTDYQVLGGEFSSNVAAIQQLIQSLEIDNRAIVWDDIIDLPVTFPPAPHLHDVGDLYGMEAVVDAINDLKELMANSNTDLFDLIDERIRALENKTIESTNEFNEVWNEINDIHSQIQALISNVEQNSNTLIDIENKSLYKPIPSNTTLSVGNKYVITSTGTSRLPDTTGLKVGSTIVCHRLINVEAIYSVTDVNVERIRYGSSIDNSVKQTTRSRLTFIYLGAGLWECNK